MKKFLLVVCTILLMCACGPNPNKGYGYNVKTNIPVTDTMPHKQGKESWWERTARRAKASRMWLYDANGEEVMHYIDAYKGEFDGKSWYVFLDGEGRMTVIENRDGKGD